MQPLSDRELRMNEEAATIAETVLSQPVEAATRCEQLTRDMKAQAMGMQSFSRIDKTLRGALMPRKAGARNEIETAGLPKSFILAVTSSYVHALEDKCDGEHLIAGNVVQSWDRTAVTARHATENFYSGTVSNARQVVIVYLPTGGVDSDNFRYLTPAARTRARIGGDMPIQMVFTKDAPSQRVLDALGATGPLVISGHHRQSSTHAGTVTPPNFTPPQPPTADRLHELETLRATGAISDAECARQREQIISEI
jgi:hypothetical protein